MQETMPNTHRGPNAKETKNPDVALWEHLDEAAIILHGWMNASGSNQVHITRAGMEWIVYRPVLEDVKE